MENLSKKVPGTVFEGRQWGSWISRLSKTKRISPFFVISSDYDKNTKDFQLFVGALIENTSIETFTIPKGIYGKVTIKPKMGLMWGLSIGEAKRTFYTEWLLKSDYTPLNMEYEYHTEISKGKNPQIDILFSIEAH